MQRMGVRAQRGRLHDFFRWSWLYLCGGASPYVHVHQSHNYPYDRGIVVFVKQRVQGEGGHRQWRSFASSDANSRMEGDPRDRPYRLPDLLGA